MSVPAHDERDYEFAKKYKIEIRLVILPPVPTIRKKPRSKPQLPFTTHDGMLVNSGEFSGLSCEDSDQEDVGARREEGFGKATVTFRLKDWGISRQRYWGTPIPMVYCEKDGIVPVPEKDLPVILPDNVDITLDRRLAAGPRAGVRECDLPEVRRPGAARDRHHGHVCRFVLVLLSLHRRAQRPARSTARMRGYWFAIPHRSVHRRRRACHSAPHLFALLDQVHARHGIGQERRTRRAPVHAGHGHQGRREDVEEPGQRGLAGRDGRALRRRRRAHVQLFAAPPDRDLDWQDAGIEGIQRFLGRVYRFVCAMRGRTIRRGASRCRQI